MTSPFRKYSLVIGVVILTAIVAACGGAPAPQTTVEVNASRGPTPVVVRILNLDYVLTVTPTAVSQPAASPSPVQSTTTPPEAATASQPQPVAAQATPTPSCTNRAELVAHLSVSPNSALKGAQLFGKVWKIRNAGECTWDETYSLVFTGGERMEAPEVVPLGAAVKPGETLDLRVNMTSPLFPGTYKSDWLLQDGYGNRFGIGPDYGQPLQVIIAVQPPPAATSG